MPQGLIVKSISGYFYVLPIGIQYDVEHLIQCRGKGLLRKNELVPLVGDQVIFEHSDHNEGTVTQILPRTNELIRPPISNVDIAVLVFSVAEPALNLQLMDKNLIVLEKSNIPCVICLTKSDLLHVESKKDDKRMDNTNDEIAKNISLYQTLGYEVTMNSSKQDDNIDWLLTRLQNRKSVIFGQSGVGKSSLMNRMNRELNLETNAISQKLGRGKHTTRHVELYSLEFGGFIADTPGFSQLDLTDIELEQLEICFREFAQYRSDCKYRGCSHINEPNCQVKQAVQNQFIAQTRYDHYLMFYQEIKERKKRYS
jgi:ribosome biogenesis GTPase